MEQEKKTRLVRFMVWYEEEIRAAAEKGRGNIEHAGFRAGSVSNVKKSDLFGDSGHS